MLQQHLPPTVCAEGCEIAEEQSDDEVRTSQVPERREGKTKVIKQQYLPLAVLKPQRPTFFISLLMSKLQQHLPLAVCAAECEAAEEQSDNEVRTSQVPERREGKTKAIKKCTTVYSIETLPLQKTRMDHMPRCNNTYCLRY